MGRVTEFPSYWRSAAEDGAMQDAHGFVWKAMLDTIDDDDLMVCVWFRLIGADPPAQ